MSIGWVLFWKAVVVAVWIAIVGRWQAYRKRRHQTGLPLKQNQQTGVYQVSDWTENVDRGARWIREGCFALAFTVWTVMGGVYLLYGWSGIEWLGLGFLGLLFPDLSFTPSA